MNAILWNLGAFIIAIAILVTFHEWGHFLFARLFKIDVLRFSIGFGKPLVRWQGRKGTEYVIAAIPLGGYVKMLDEREGPVPAARLPYAFNRQAVAKRLAVVSAGPLFNFIFAILACWLMFVIGITQPIPYIESVANPSIAAKADLKAGDEIIAINNVAVDNWRSVLEQLLVHGKDEPAVVVKVKTANGTMEDKSADLSSWVMPTNDDPFDSLGIHPYYPKMKPIVDEVSAGEPAELAGLKSGDEIQSVDQQPVDSWLKVVELIKLAPNKAVHLQVLRDSKVLPLTLTPRAKEDAGKTIGYAGIKPKFTDWPKDKLRLQHYSLLGAITPALHKTWEITTLTATLLYKLAGGLLSASTISGPIGIAQGAGASASGGISQYLSFLALVSISLAILNLLPIPVLDGGHIFYFLIESIRGKPVSEKTQEWGFRVGLTLLIGLMILAFYNDFARLLM